MALETNLVANYRMEGNSNDNAGSNNGTDTSIVYGNTYGFINQGASFSSAYSDIGTGIDMTGNFTVNAWVYFNGAGYGGFYWYVMANDNNTGVRQGGFGVDDQGKIHSDRNVADVLFHTGTALSLNTWTMLTYTYDGSVITGYMNASSQNALSMSAFASTTNHEFIGKRQYSGAEGYWQGYIDELSVWSRALSGTEVTTLYNSGIGMYFNGSTFVAPGAAPAGSMLLMFR